MSSERVRTESTKFHDPHLGAEDELFPQAPHKFYQGSFERVIQREFYGQTYQVGVRFDY